MVRNARVVRLLEGGMAEITVARRSACAHDCENCKGGCTPSMLIRTEARNAAGAREGDEVTVESPGARILGLAALVYLVPVFLFLIFYLVSGAFSFTEGGRALVGGAGFFLGFLPAVLINRGKAGKTELVITSVVRPKDEYL